MAEASKTSEWWRGGIIYQIYPRSFADFNDDGVGDLAGITSKLDYIKSLNVDAIWISPFFKSPMRDFGYDVSDFEAVDPLFGTMEDFDHLVAECKKRDLKVMIDLVISHTSSDHPWFIESRQSHDNPKSDWYVWADPKPDGNPPNNWLSIFGGSAWQWDATRKQYYLHNFLTSQPDLNFHNPDVCDAVLDIAKFWLDKGVQGFRLDTVNFYFHDKELRSNPPHEVQGSRDDVPDSNPYGMQKHIHDKTQPENLLFLERLRKLMDQYPDTATVGEIGDDGVVQTMAQYTEAGKRLHMAYSFAMLNPRFGASYIRGIIEKHRDVLGDGWPCWAYSNHDVCRVVSRWNARPTDRTEFAKLLLAMISTLGGSACIYQGEELGLPEADVPYEKLQDPYGIEFWPEFKGRDGCRTPMPWHSRMPHGGFSSVEPWLPVAGEHGFHAVDVQESHADSVLMHYRKFIPWRNSHEVLRSGSIQLEETNDPILAYIREGNGEKLYFVCNLSGSEQSYTLPESWKQAEPVVDGHGFAPVKIENGALQLPKYAVFIARSES